MKQIVIAAGGTGGHLYPGIALATELKKRNYKVSFAIKTNDTGKHILEKEGFDYFEVSAMGFPRGLSPRIFIFVFSVLKSFFQAYKKLGRIKPAIVIGMGGYISFPVIIASFLRRLPSVIHEQNLVPGLANRELAFFVSKVAVSFDNTARYFPKEKTSVTGNPVRKELFKPSPIDPHTRFGLWKNKFTVFVFGGSQGASKINELVLKSLEFLAQEKDKLQFIHVCGKYDLATVSESFKKSGFQSKVLDYLIDIGDAYQAADLIIARAGASTLSELKILNKPSIIIPYPHATADHQKFNAMDFAIGQDCVVTDQKDLTGEKLAELISAKVAEKPAHKLPFRPPKKFPQEILADIIEQTIS
jgi:UDP-N-acetylglucosamine--N-acetylmuramyl-(pentapeptide) pyrophosphoryl-undecaprenol N-acetylglucosamine transferase